LRIERRVGLGDGEGGLLVLAVRVGEEDFEEAFVDGFGAVLVGAYLGDGGQGAEVWVDEELEDEAGSVTRRVAGRGGGVELAGQVVGGHLKAVEEQAGALWVERVGGDAGEDIG
jgi:hypothetical protein